MSSRKAKRQIISDDDSDGETNTTVSPKRTKHVDPARSIPPSRRPPSEETQPKPSTSKTPRREPKKSKKRKHTEDDEDDYNVDVEELAEDLATVAPGQDFEDDSSYSSDSAPRRKKGGGKGKVPTKTGGKAGVGKAKSKPKPEEKAITMKDERKTAPPPAKRQKPNIRTEGSSELARHKSPPSASREKESPIPPVPPKKKLPTIKKNKDALSAAPATPSIAARAQLQTTTADVDLSNSSIYSELFNKASGNKTPRSGLSRADERRAEIAKMREDARTKRAIESRHFFNLQANTEKILAYEEEVLRSHRSSVLFPNILGAKWKEEYDRSLRHRSNGASHVAYAARNGGAQYPAEEKEEGEM